MDNRKRLLLDLKMQFALEIVRLVEWMAGPHNMRIHLLYTQTYTSYT